MMWNMLTFPKAGSTNTLASKEPAWTAIRADIQTTGRSRHGRTWDSQPGGLWLSAVIPAPPPRKQWEILPLAVGCVVMEVLKKLGVHNPRLRWPNDILINDQKLCGILVERFNDQTAVIGIGLNISNQPQSEMPAIRLADLLKSPPNADELANLILKKLRVMQKHIEKKGWETYRRKLNRQWKRSTPVVCHLNQTIERGLFTGVDADGNLLLRQDGQTLTLNAAQVQLLRHS